MSVNDKKITPDKIKYNAKLQLQRYLESFFKGSNRQWLAISSPMSLNYNIEHSSVESTNVKERKLQIARYFNELKNVLPAVVITDGVMKNISQSIGLLSSAHGSIYDFKGTFNPFREITINMIIGSNDAQTTDMLVSTVSSFFNEYRNVAGGHYLAGNFNKGENWVVTLPNAGVDFETVQEQPIADDPTDRVFYSSASFNIYYEDVIKFNQVVEYDLQQSTNKAPIFDIPDTIPFNKQLQVKVKHCPVLHKIAVSDYRMATINNQSGMLTPRSLGKVKVYLMDQQGKIKLEKEIEIIP
jgi:hypothetical protein